MTSESRFIAVLTAIAGGIFTAFMIGLIRQTLTLTKEEENIYSFVDNHTNNKTKKDAAAKLITLTFRMMATIRLLE